MMNYYNEWEPYAAQWLRNLIREGLIPNGFVDTRSIQEVEPGDLLGYTQCHFFAGIGGWSLALQLAGIPSDTELWTGSVPCQPYSSAGKKKGFADERHLWPAFFDLIKVCRPARVYGEQVANAIRWGWLDALQADLENEAYAVCAAVLPACGCGAPHRRDRLYWCGVLEQAEVAGVRGVLGIVPSEAGSESAAGVLPEPRRAGEGSMADADQQLREHDRIGGGGEREIEDDQSGRHPVELPRRRGAPGGLVHADHSGQQEEHLQRRLGEPGSAGDLGDADRPRLERSAGQGGQESGDGFASAGETFWDDCEWIPCRDGKVRPIEPGLKPLAHGVPKRVGKLRAYGNAIVPQVAAEFIKSFMIADEEAKRWRAWRRKHLK